MAKNLSVTENIARFFHYPHDLRVTTSELQHRKLSLLASRIHEAEIVLDVGCNSGHFADFVPKSCRLYGVDVSPDLVERARPHYAGVEVACGENLPFDDFSFDVVVLSGVLEYFFEPQLALREADRVARRAIIGTAEHELGIWGRHRVEKHDFMVRSYDEPTLRRELEAIGDISWFDIVSQDGVPQHYLFEVTFRG